ncbi:MAG: energy transducer TonB [Pseudomonadota bacterium]
MHTTMRLLILIFVVFMLVTTPACIMHSPTAQTPQAESIEAISPVLLVRVSPGYPREAVLNDVEGLVVLSFEIDPKGRTQDIRVETSEPPGVFDESAVQAVSRWLYKPSSFPIGQRHTMRIDFLLDSEKPMAYRSDPVVPLYAISDADTQPQFITRINPTYPNRAMAQKVSGSVTIEFTIHPDGRVYDPTVIDSRPEGVFDTHALNAVHQWTFIPATKNGQAVAVRATQTIDFKPTTNPEVP